MNLITILGMASFVFVAIFTIRAYRNNNGTGQTPRDSIIEAWFNIFVGFSLNYGLNFWLLPYLGASLTLLNNFLLGWIYTAASMLRQYALRRLFNGRSFSDVLRIAERKALALKKEWGL